MSITAKELAKILGLSPAAVSMALNQKPGVSAKTREKVISTAKQYGYDFSKREYPSLTSSASTKGALLLLVYRKSGVVVSDSPFFNEVFEGIHEKCSQLHYTLSIQYLYDREQAQAALRGNKADGIILLGTEMAAEDYQPFERCPVPIVVLDTYFETVQANYVLINNTQGAYQATGFLIKRCMSQPGYLRSAYPIGNFNERANGFYQAIRDYGMSPSKSVVHLLSPAPDGAYADMCCLLEQQEELACCYFADNDAIACAAMRALQEHGYRIPEDISIIGFDDIPVCGYVVPALTTVRVSKRYLGNTAVSHLIRLMEEKTNVCCKIEISTELVVRGSVR